MGLKIKKLISCLTALVFLCCQFSSVRATLSLDDCKYYLARQCLDSNELFHTGGAFPLARSAVLIGAIEKTKKFIEENIDFVYEEEELAAWEGFRKTIKRDMPEIWYELNLCLRYSDTPKELLESLNNMRMAYLEYYNAYEKEGYRKRSYSF